MIHKYFFIVLIGFLSSFSMVAQISKVEIIATGLTCSMCSNAINKQLKSLAEVDSVAVDLNTNTFTVFIKSYAKVTPKLLKERVEKAGFFVGSMIADFSLVGVNVADNVKLELDGIDLLFVDTKPNNLDGIIRLKILDKGYVTNKEFKKLSKSLSKFPSYKIENEDDYHIKQVL